MLQLEGVHAGYPGCPVLHGVDLILDDASCVAVLGRNGVGKTTLVKTIMGLVGVRAGSITLDGADLTRFRADRRARLGLTVVPQGRDIFGGLTVYENLKVAALAHGREGWRERIDSVLDEFPVLSERSRAGGETLSGGQQQILAIARALVMEPRLLLLDEPTDGVQPSILDDIAETLLRVHRERGVAILLVEQNLDFAGLIADEALIMDGGEIRAQLSIADLQSSRHLQRELLAV
jgi:ABC-type branched-subunit amino acid transport system ATPase component